MSMMPATLKNGAFRLAAHRLRWRAQRAVRKVLGRKRTTFLDDRAAEYRAYWEAASKALGASFVPTCRDIWEIRKGERRTRVANYLLQIDDPVVLRVAGDKPYCCSLARRHGIPTAPGRVFSLRNVEAAWRFMSLLHGAFVVKPANRAAGVGVTLHVRTRRELESAAALASLYSDELMIEAMVPAETCRLLYLDGELIHAVRRRGVRVTGDGASSIRTLLIRRNLARFAADQATLATLEAQRLSPESVIPCGKETVVRYLPAGQARERELRTVYNECITDLVSRELARSLVPLIESVGSRYAGIDVLTNDPAVPLAESGGVFLELNTTPAMHHHYVAGEGPSVALRILRYLLEENRHEQRSDRLFPAERRALP